MCLAVPAKIVELDGVNAVVEVDGVKRDANITFVPDAGLGDFVLVHAGFAIQKWGEEDVQEFHEIMGDIESKLEGIG